MLLTHTHSSHLSIHTHVSFKGKQLEIQLKFNNLSLKQSRLRRICFYGKWCCRKGEKGGWVRGERVLKLLSVIYDKCNLFTTRCSFIQDKLFVSLPTQLHGKLLAGLTGRMANGTPEQLSSSMATNNTTKTKTTGRKQTSKANKQRFMWKTFALQTAEENRLEFHSALFCCSEQAGVGGGAG